jgi:putative transposase
LKQTRYTEAQIADTLAQAARGELFAVEVCRINGISERTFYRWKRRYGAMTTSEVKRLRELEAENTRLQPAAYRAVLAPGRVTMGRRGRRSRLRPCRHLQTSESRRDNGSLSPAPTARQRMDQLAGKGRIGRTLGDRPPLSVLKWGLGVASSSLATPTIVFPLRAGRSVFHLNSTSSGTACSRLSDRPGHLG